MADDLFQPPKPEPKGSMRLPVLIGAGVVVLAVVLLFVFSHRTVGAPTTVAPLDANAASLPITEIEMSEATSPFAGGRSTYIDGKITNNANRTVSQITVQAIFRDDSGQTISLQTIPLTLIRTREPYVDTMAVSSRPIPPGATVDFRLIFEGLPAAWNQQQPELHLISIKF